MQSFEFDNPLQKELDAENPSVLDEADEAVNGDREENYGHPADNHGRIAGAINALYGTDFEAKDVAIIMAITKLSRLTETPRHRDSVVDWVGYAIAYEQIIEREEGPLE